MYVCMYVCMHSVYKVDYRGAAAPKNLARSPLDKKFLSDLSTTCKL